MGDLSQHFNRSEFRCHCGECGFDTVDHQTLGILEAVREHFRSPVIVTSGCRCESHNRAIGGATHSQHVLARAADIQVKGVGPDEVQDWIEANYPHASVGRYATFTHIDTRSDGPARWRG
ncbi:D-Ala-D-Ala carboxypeptidase family metallohydrolase [Kushneria sp. AK178]